jgi:hypothetical protein
MIEGSKSAFPIPILEEGGLTKREYAAIEILAGIWSDSQSAGSDEQLAAQAVKSADALLAELEKDQPKP